MGYSVIIFYVARLNFKYSLLDFLLDYLNET